MNSNKERHYTCNRCGGDYVARADDRNGLCGECAEFHAYSKLARQTLRQWGGRGDFASANEAMGYPSFRANGSSRDAITYLVREHGGSIPMQTLCAAHDALYVWDALGSGLSGDDAAAHYTTQAPAGNCDTCNEFEYGRARR
jgi:hypothetical protein